MPGFKKLKLIKEAMSPEAIRQGLEASRQAMATGFSGPTEEQLAAMSPEQRAAYEENMRRVAEAQAQAAAAQQQYLADAEARRTLGGAAGEHVHGRMPTTPGSLEESMAETKAQFKDALRNPFRAMNEGPEAAQASPEAQAAAAADPVAHAAGELAARDAARRPYLAPDRAPVAITRIATRAKTQLGEVAQYLGTSGLAGRPDLVYGIARVPDHLGHGMVRGSKRVVEWEVVHAATTELAPAPAPTAAWFDARERWVLRRPGEPTVLDEELAVAYLQRAGIGPEQSLGIARFVDIRNHSGGEDGPSYVVTQVTGVHAFHPAGPGQSAFAAMEAERPLRLAPPAGVHVAVLNWGAIAKAVRPQTHRAAPVPSPFPHLPGSPQELLRAYLDIVGVQPRDCYSAQATEDHARDIVGVGTKGIFTTSTNVGEKQPCADGEARSRLTGCSRVVVAYRDSAAAAAGRERWAAYQREVLDARLDVAPGAVGDVDWLDKAPKTLRRAVRAAEWVGDVIDGDGDDPFEDIPPHRYCWPPER